MQQFLLGFTFILIIFQNRNFVREPSPMNQMAIFLKWPPNNRTGLDHFRLGAFFVLQHHQNTQQPKKKINSNFVLTWLQTKTHHLWLLSFKNNCLFLLAGYAMVKGSEQQGKLRLHDTVTFGRMMRSERFCFCCFRGARTVVGRSIRNPFVGSSALCLLLSCSYHKSSNVCVFLSKTVYGG